VNVLDVFYLINFLYKGGPVPEDASISDVDSDGNINLLDVLYLISYLYRGGPAPDCSG